MLRHSTRVMLVLLGLWMNGASANFTGTVIDWTGQPVEGATVEVYQVSVSGSIFPSPTGSASTDIHGHYAIQSSLTGWFIVRAFAEGRVPFQSGIYIRFQQTPVVLGITLLEPGQLRVRVVSEDDGTPVAGVQVAVTRWPEGNQQTDADGWAQFDALQGDYPACVVAGNGEFARACLGGEPLGFSSALTGEHARVDAGATTEIALPLRVGAALSGRVIDLPSGLAIAERELQVTVVSGSGRVHSMAVRTDAEGNYRAAGLPDGAFVFAMYAQVDAMYWLEQAFPGVDCMFYPRTACTYWEAAPVTLAAGTTVEHVDFTLRPQSSLAGSVRAEEDDAPLAGVDVEVYMHAHGDVSLLRTTKSETDGRFAFDHLPYGVRLVVATANQLGRIDQAGPPVEACSGDCWNRWGIWTEAGSTRDDIDFRLARGPRLVGGVRLADSRVARDVAIRVYDGSLGLAWAGVTGQYGEFETAGLPPGEYYLRAVAADTGSCVVYPNARCIDSESGIDVQTAGLIGVAGLQPVYVGNLMLPSPVVMRSGFEWWEY